MEDVQPCRSHTQWQPLSPVTRGNNASNASTTSSSSHSNGYLDTTGYHGNPQCSPASSTSGGGGGGYTAMMAPSPYPPAGSSTSSSETPHRRLTPGRGGDLTPGRGGDRARGMYSSPAGSVLSETSNPGTPAVYVDAKTSMLEIIEEGLNLKLEIQSIKDQFLTLIEDLDKFDGSSGENKMKASPVLTPQTTTASPGLKKQTSTTRARVRALYAARKERIMSKRAASSDFSHNPKQAKMACQDKENVGCYSPASSSRAPVKPPRKSLPTLGKKLLTPIREENKFAPKCINNNNVMFTSPRTPLSDIEGDYVTLKSPSNVMTTPRTSHVRAPRCSPVSSSSRLNDTSIWVDSPKAAGHHGNHGNQGNRDSVGLTARLSNAGISPIKHDSPKFASSDAISEIYTSKALKDISTISSRNNATLREQMSSAQLPGMPVDAALHSTFNYPLHSTMNYPLHSTINLFDDCKASPKSSPIASDSPAARTTTTTTTAVIRSASRTPTLPPRQSKTHVSKRVTSAYVSMTSEIDVDVTPPQQQLPVARQYSEADFRTPTKKPQATLCKEHGIHPTFGGGPCIFQTDDSIGSSSLDEDEVLPATSSSARRPYLDTDCDSSYLSECVDDVSFSVGDDVTHTYDARTARMRMLKRQTGQTELQREEEEMRYPIGLSESDLNFDVTQKHMSNFDVTQKHMSLQCTRASLPDFSGLSTFPSEAESESTLHNSSRRGGHGADSADDFLSHDDTLVSVPSISSNHGNKQRGSSSRRPLSVATTDDSPESAASLQVPVNSPNITDSGGSSSRPTTDTYDYVELPLVAGKSDNFKVPTLPPPKRRSSSQARASSSSRAAYTQNSSSKPSDSKSLRSYKSQRSARSGRSSKSHQPSRDWAEIGSPRYSSLPPSTSSQHRERCGESPHRQRPEGGHFDVIDTAGTKRTVVHHKSVSKNLQPERKKQLKKQLKQFNNNFNKPESTTNLHIKTLGHF